MAFPKKVGEGPHLTLLGLLTTRRALPLSLGEVLCLLRSFYLSDFASLVGLLIVAGYRVKTILLLTKVILEDGVTYIQFT